MPDATLKKITELIAATDANPEVRQAAVLLAGVVGSASERALVKELLAALEADELELRLAAIEALGRLHVEEALPRLEGFVRQGGPELEAAVHSASQLGARGAKLMGKVMPQVGASLRSRIGDVMARAGTGNALVVTAQGLLDPDPRTVDSTARSLASEVPSYSQAQRNALGKFLVEALGAKKPGYAPRSEAAMIRVLGALQDSRAEEIFWARLKPGSAPEVRAAALQALGAKAAPSTSARLEQLLACAAEKDFSTVAAALMILKNVPVSAKQARTWVQLLHAPDVATRRFAVEKLHGVENAEVAQALLAQLSHPDRSLHDEALDALRAFEAGRQVFLDHLLDAETADETWSRARALTPVAAALTEAQRSRLFTTATKHHDADDRRSAGLWFLLRETDAHWVRDQIEERAHALRKKKKYAEAMAYYRLLTQDPACGEETRYEMAATGLKLSSHDLSPEHRTADQSLHQFTRLLQNQSFDVLARLSKEKWLETADLFYLGFHFVEQTHRPKEFGKSVLELVINRSPQSELGKQAKRKLKSAGLA